MLLPIRQHTETYLAKTRKLPGAHTSTTQVRRIRPTQREATIGEPCQPMDGYSWPDPAPVGQLYVVNLPTIDVTEYACDLVQVL